MPEEWKDVPGYEGIYSVSSLGRVRSSRVVLKQCKDGHGYNQVTLCKDGNGKKKQVATVVLEAFSGPRPTGLIVCHGPGGKNDNSISNLSWGTWSKNQGEDRVRDGSSNRGSKNGMSVLEEVDVRFIKHWLRSGFSCRDVAAPFNVSRQTISDIKFGRRWAWMQ